MLSISVTGLSGYVANIYAANAAVQRHVLSAVKENGLDHQQRVRYEAPKDTWFMTENTRLDFSDGGYTYRVGYNAADFYAAGKPFYPPYVIFGTSRMQANDFVFRATEPMRDIATRRVGDAVKAGVLESAL